MSSYLSIYDCPAWNFAKASEDVRYLLKLDNYNKLPVGIDTSELQQVYESLYYQFLDEFGVGPSEGAILGMNRDILAMEIEYQVTGNETLKARISVLNSRLKALQQQSGANIFDVAAAVSKWAGYDISPLKLTVVEFFSKLNQYEKSMAKVAKRGGGDF